MAVPTVTAGDRPAPQPRHARRPGWVLLRLGTAAGAGWLLYIAAAPGELWWLAPVAFAVLWLALHGRTSARLGFGYGLTFGLGLFVPLLSWVGQLVGPLPWLALATVEALVLALAGAGIATVSRLPAAPMWATGVWVAAEALIARVPFDGFPWGRVAFGQPTGLFLPVAAIGGAPLLTAAVVLTGFGAGELVRRLVLGHLAPKHLGPGHPVLGRRLVTLAVPALLAVAPMIASLAAAPLAQTAAPDGEVVAAVVQGNVPRAGLDFNAQRRAVLDNHAERTEQLAIDVTAGRYPQPALVIWPENSSDIDPLRNPDARVVIDRAVRAIGVPILVGAVLRTDDGPATNTAIVWSPSTGPGQRHDKRRLQPFGEYIPHRDFFRLFSPYVDRAGNFTPGNGDGAVDLGPVRVGIATCSEVIFDDLVRQSVRSGAQVLAVPTNNATFGFTEMSYQQQAISRVRAVEHGRAVLVAATSGVSAVIAADGTVEQHTDLFAPDALVSRVPLHSSTTLATRLGPVPEWSLVVLGVLGVAAALVMQRGPNAGNRQRPAPVREDVDG
ncbi:MAG: apolipoprotein N-acyltransferase [Actinomycetota bacterium]|nr:apolipoprotein N-acyltransferase [Actinomycetota bacterium]